MRQNHKEAIYLGTERNTQQKRQEIFLPLLSGDKRLPFMRMRELEDCKVEMPFQPMANASDNFAHSQRSKEAYKDENAQ